MFCLTEEALVAMVRCYAVEVHGSDWADRVIDPTADLDTLGFDSVDAVLLTNSLGDSIGIEVDPALFLRHRTIRGVIHEMKRLNLILG